MSKLFFTFLASFAIFMAVQSTASAYTKAIMTDPFDLMWGGFNVRYETMVSPKNSIVPEFRYNYGYWSWTTGFEVGATYRWYLRDVFPVRTKGIEGFNVGPFAIIGMYHYDWPGHSDETDYNLVIGGEASYKWVFSGFVVEPTLRLGFAPVKSDYMNGYRWGFGVNIGYGW